MLKYEPQAYPSLGKTFLPALENCMTNLEEAQKKALAAHETAHQIIKEQSMRNFSPWKVGDKVWLEATNLCLHYPSQKLSPKRQGLFKISQVLQLLMYCLWLPPTWTIHNVFHTSLLSPYQEMLTHGPNFLSPPSDLVRTEEKYEVEHIVSHWGTVGQQWYLTAWKGYPLSENMWESEFNLKHAAQLLTEYKTTHHLSFLQHESDPEQGIS